MEKECRERHRHEPPKRAGLSSRIPLDTLQPVVTPEMVQEERQKLVRRIVNLCSTTCVLNRAPHTREERIAQERKAVGEPLLMR
jgi:hypothetical protein